ncbi:MAG: hypothetical protein CMJ45_11490 [Planctomyces sp.]|jgi:uncharacterized protein YciW|nr:hypothetical protein [Planctomyces sp.]
MDDIFKSVVAEAAGISANHPLASVLAGRDEVMQLTQASHDAALKPEPPGGLSHSERAALACRMARLNDEGILAKHYEAMIPEGSEPLFMADPVFIGGDDNRAKAILRHTDLVTTNPKQASESDISALRSAGIPEPDIVRLSELIAFVGYQVRVVKGLRLMAEAA